jgi:hypothetical protein
VWEDDEAAGKNGVKKRFIVVSSEPETENKHNSITTTQRRVL